MRRIMLAALMLVASSAFADCSKESANKVLKVMSQMGSWKVLDSALTIEFKWGSDIDNTTPRERLKLFETFANADACIVGRARKIEYYRRGKLIGLASPDFGIKLVD